jgi:hypothetical protein
LPIERSQGPYLQAAVEAELTRLLAESGLAAELQTDGALPSIRADAMRFKPGNTPTQWGKQIARSVYSGIGNGK